MGLGKTGVIIAARTNSTRLPGKALLPLQGMPMVLFLLERLRHLKNADVVLATTDLTSDDRLADIVAQSGTQVFRGDAQDLVARYTAAATAFGFDTVGRVTADCPFVNGELIEHCLAQAAETPFDLATTKGAFPVGLDVELYSAKAMAGLNANPDLSPAHREHLTLYMYDHMDRFIVRRLQPRAAWCIAGATFTVDTVADYEAATALANSFDRPDFSLQSLIERAAS